MAIKKMTTQKPLSKTNQEKKMREYIYRCLQVCFCQGRDPNAKQEDWVDPRVEWIMEKLAQVTQESYQKGGEDMVERVKTEVIGEDGKYSEPTYTNATDWEIVARNDGKIGLQQILLQKLTHLKNTNLEKEGQKWWE